MDIRRLAISTALVSLIVSSGCTSKQREQTEESRQGGAQVVPQAPTDSIGAPAGGATSTPATRSSSVTEIFSRIHEHESQISQIITAGRLNEVETEAIALRDLLMAAVAQASISADQRATLDDHVAVAKYAISAVIKAAKSGDVNDAKAQNSRMQGELGKVERMVVGPAM